MVGASAARAGSRPQVMALFSFNAKSHVRAVCRKVYPARCVIIEMDQYQDFKEQEMKKEFEDIHIIGKPDPNKVRAGSKSYTHRFFFPLSSVPPQRWNELLVQEWVYRIMQNPRHIWVNDDNLVIDCPGGELSLIVDRVGADIEIVNRKYRKEVQGNEEKTEHERRQAVEEKRIDDAALRKIINELKLPC